MNIKHQLLPYHLIGIAMLYSGYVIYGNTMEQAAVVNCSLVPRPWNEATVQKPLDSTAPPLHS